MSSTQPSHPAEPTQHQRLNKVMHRVLDALGWVTAAGVLTLLLGAACAVLDDEGRCESDADCPTDRPICGKDIEAAGFCVECDSNDDCNPGETCSPSDFTCKPLPCSFSSAPQCGGECPAGEECSDQGGTCVCVPESECTGDADCAPGDVCNTATNECETPCTTDADCTASTNGSKCANGQCTQCVSDADCLPFSPPFGDPLVCIDGRCGRCASDADCQNNAFAPYCSRQDPICVQCLMKSHCQEGQQCIGGLCEYLFATNPNVSITLSDNRSGASPETSVSFSSAKDELQLFSVQFSSFSPLSGFIGFDVLGPANTVIGRGTLDHNGDGVADDTVDIRSVDQNNAYADMNRNGVADSGEPTIAKINFSFVVTLPAGGDGDLSTLINPFGGRITITFFSGIFTLDACPGTSPIDVTLTSVDQGGGDANDNLHPPPLFRTVTVEIDITTPATCGDGDVDFCEVCDPGASGESATCDNNCTFAFCGDGTINQAAGEQCDEGLRCDDGVTLCERTSQCPRLPDGTRSCSTRNINGCTETCQFDASGAVCGNGAVESGEACDDGNLDDSDGCSSACTEELGHDCSGDPSVCTPICGDGLIVGDELCDDSNTVTETQCSYGTSECTACNATCTETLTLTGSFCGDGELNVVHEQCDDGNTNNGDGCSAACTSEAGFCGDGQIDDTEECDGADLDEQTCQTLGFSGGTLSCTETCVFDTSACTPLPAGPIQTLPNLQSVKIYEITFATTPTTYAPDASQLTTRLPDPLTDVNNDFTFFTQEYYDVFYSDWDGAPDPDGSFLTIEGVWRGGLAGFGFPAPGGMNINEVELVFSGGMPSRFGDFVASFEYGTGQVISGSEALAVDHNLATYPQLGQTSDDDLSDRFRLTIGFNGISQVSICGDGLVNGTEQCDDGNTTAGDGCSSTCQEEPGWTCTTTAGQPSVCTPVCTPTPEVCNGLDDDCDGTPDEGNPDGGGLCFTHIPGLCSGGIENCIDGRIECQPVHQPSPEVCDGLDNDCDGLTDNVLGFGLPCTVGDGDCQRSGEFVCKEGSLQCSAIPGEPGTEICGNNIDEDCDGADLPCPVTPLNNVKGVLNLDLDQSEDKVAVQAVAPLPGATAQTVSPAPGIPFDPLTEGAALRLEQAGNIVVNLQFPPGEGWKVNKKGNTWSFKDKKDGSLGDPSKDTVSVQCNTKKQTCSIKVNVRETELGAVTAGEITATIIIGDDRFQKTQEWKEKAKGKKLVTP